MKVVFLFIICSISFLSVSQNSEDLIPKEALTVFSINNISLLQKIPMDDLVKYEFMEEVQQELFDGSTSGKTLKDSGIDFDQKLNIFYGKGDDFEVSGFTFGVKQKEQLFIVFDDFTKEDSPYPGVEFYSSFFNNLIIKGNVAVLLRIEPTVEKIDAVTDSIWYARGNQNPWYNDKFEEFEEEESEDFEDEEESIFNESPEQDKTLDPNQKNYYELRDSVQLFVQKELLQHLCQDLLVANLSLKSQDTRFANQLTHTSDGIFFLDNSKNVQKAKGLWYFQTMFPALYEDIKELYSENVVLGDLLLKDNAVEFQMEARFGQELGSIYQKMNNAKFDKNALKYIRNDASAYFSYNINLREAYEQAYKIIMPVLTKNPSPRITTSVLTIELLNDFVNKDALFDTYKGSLFGTFNGIQKIKTKKIVFTYDDETFEYSEEEVDAEEDMPIFTLGFSTERSDIPEKILSHLSRLTSRFEKKGNYWQFNNAILDAAPLFMFANNGVFIFTNDENLAKNHSNGYGPMALSKREAKKAKESGFLYGKIDLSKAIQSFPKDFFNEEQNAILDAMRGKTGVMELTSSKTNPTHINFNLNYLFEGTYENSGKYLLDLLNSIYVISK